MSAVVTVASTTDSEIDSEDGGKVSRLGNECALRQALVKVDGRTQTFDFDIHTTVLQLKHLIFDRIGYPPERTQISFHQRVIDDPACTLSSLDLSDDPMHVELAAKLNGLPGGTKVCSVLVFCVLSVCVLW